MRRADRLFQIIQLLRHRRLTTASQLAERLAVSERTIYRDIQDLIRSGVPITGEAGMGYRMGKHVDLPPLMFDADEIQALVLGARMVEHWGDAELRQAARSALDKVAAVLPPDKRHRLRDTALFALSFAASDAVREHVGTLRKAIDGRRKVTLRYRDKAGSTTERTLRPLALYFWGDIWTLGSWCELRQSYRNFRLDRIAAVALEDETFELVSPVTLEDFVRTMKED